MQSNTLSKKILIIENSEKDYMDILNCLPKSLIPEHRLTINDDDIAALEYSDYILCICDILVDIMPVSRGLSLESPYTFNLFKRGIKQISKLCQHLDCHLVIATKFPIRYLRDNFDNLKKDPDMDMGAIFGKDIKNLYQKLDANKYLPWGIVYVSEKIHIVIKPYVAKAVPDNNEALWRNELTKLLNELCLLD